MSGWPFGLRCGLLGEKQKSSTFCSNTVQSLLSATSKRGRPSNHYLYSIEHVYISILLAVNFFYMMSIANSSAGSRMLWDHKYNFY